MKKYWALIFILAGGTALRFYHNLDVSLWHDEAFSALLIKYPWPEMMYRLGLDVHPPMYYIFLRLWSYIFGDSLLSLRGMSIFFGSASIWAGWLFVRQAFKNEKAALWAALLLAINPFQLRFVTEARMYTMGAFFAILAGYFLIRLLNLQKQLHEAEALHMPHLPADIKNRNLLILNYIGFIASTIIIIYTHYYLFFTAAALGLYGLLYLYFHHKWDAKKYFWYLGSWLIIAASFLPWLKVFLFQLHQVEAGYWIAKMNIWSIPATFWDLLLALSRDTSKTSTDIWLIFVFLLSLFIIYRFVRKTDSFHKWLVVLAIFAPFFGSLVFLLMAKLKGSQSSVFLDRYFLFAGVFYSIALAMWLKQIRFKWLSLGLVLGYTVLNLVTFANFWGDIFSQPRPGMSGAAKFLSANVEPGQHVFVGTSYEFFNYKYYASVYNPIPTRPLLFTGGRNDISQISHVEGVAILTNQDLVPDFKLATKRGDTVWLLWTYAFGSSKPETPKNWVVIDEKEYPDIRPYVGTSIYVTEYKVN